MRQHDFPPSREDDSVTRRTAEAELLEQHELARIEWTMDHRLTRVTVVATARPELAIGEECPPGMFLLQGVIQLFFQLRGVDVRPETSFACEELHISCSG